MTGRILFIEDEHAFAVGMIDRLKSEGYAIEHVTNGQEGLQRAQRDTFDLILLDVMLPGKSGFDVSRDLRLARVMTPILMLTARDEVADRVVGLKLGADDYVAKNCDVVELLARVEALIRRGSAAVEMTAHAVAFGDVRVDFKAKEVTRHGAPVQLSPVEFRLLKYLIEHRGLVVSREELLGKVWGFHSEMLTRTVDVHMANLRRKIERFPRFPEYIITVKGAGYKMTI
jgi:DNA-binding response OmpR family regulator